MRTTPTRVMRALGTCGRAPTNLPTGFGPTRGSRHPASAPQPCPMPTRPHAPATQPRVRSPASVDETPGRERGLPPAGAAVVAEGEDRAVQRPRHGDRFRASGVGDVSPALDLGEPARERNRAPAAAAVAGQLDSTPTLAEDPGAGVGG